MIKGRPSLPVNFAPAFTVALERISIEMRKGLAACVGLGYVAASLFRCSGGEMADTLA
jgi:hypothetical protein